MSEKKQIACIIVDDEPPAIRLLKKYVEKVPFLTLKGDYTNPLEALQQIEKGKIDEKWVLWIVFSKNSTVTYTIKSSEPF